MSRGPWNKCWFSKQNTSQKGVNLKSCFLCLDKGEHYTFPNSYSASSETTWYYHYCQHDLARQLTKLPEYKRLKQHSVDNEVEIVKVKIEYSHQGQTYLKVGTQSHGSKANTDIATMAGLLQ